MHPNAQYLKNSVQVTLLDNRTFIVAKLFLYTILCKRIFYSNFTFPLAYKNKILSLKEKILFFVILELHPYLHHITLLHEQFYILAYLLMTSKVQFLELLHQLDLSSE